MDEKLAIAELEKLISVIQLLVEKHKAEGLITQEIRTEKNFTIEGYMYNFNGPNYKSISTRNQFLEKWRVNGNELINEIKQTTEFNCVLETLNKINPAKGGTKTVEGFSEGIYDAILGISNNTVGEMLGYFLNDFFNEDVEFIIEVFLQGLVIESESLDLGNSMILRQVGKEDFEEKILKHTSRDEMIGNITACLVFKAKLKSEDIYNRIMNNLRLQILKISLISNGAVRKVIEFPKYYSIKHGWVGVGSLIDRNWYGFDKFVLRKENESEFIEKFNRINPSLNLISKDETSIDHLSIAYNHYVESYLNQANIDKRIAQNIMGLEALFSDENNSDLKFKLSTRIARMAKYFEYDEPILLRDFIKKAYDIRSKFAHGGHYSKKGYSLIERNFWNEMEFLNRLHNILANSILLFSLDEFSKKDFINEIDNSFIDTKYLDVISKRIECL